MQKETILTVTLDGWNPKNQDNQGHIAVNLRLEDGSDRCVGWSRIEEGKLAMRMGESVNEQVEHFVNQKVEEADRSRWQSIKQLKRKIIRS